DLFAATSTAPRAAGVLDGTVQVAARGERAAIELHASRLVVPGLAGIRDFDLSACAEPERLTARIAALPGATRAGRRGAGGLVAELQATPGTRWLDAPTRRPAQASLQIHADRIPADVAARLAGLELLAPELDAPRGRVSLSLTATVAPREAHW